VSWPPGYKLHKGSGYEVTFHDFCRLISEASSQPSIAPLMREWFSYEIIGQGHAAVVRASTGEAVDLQALHALIQSDPQKQYTLYQQAMDLWR
jgi:hypothetical protein